MSTSGCSLPAKPKMQHTEVLLARSLACEPQPLVYRRAQVLMMLAEEGRRPIRVRSAEERVAVPPVKEEGRGLRNRRVREHGLEDFQDFLLNLCVGQCLDALREITLGKRPGQS